MKVTVNRSRALQAVRSLQVAFTEGTGLLSDVSDLVEHQVPTGVTLRSREHGLFLFFTVVNDHGVKSRLLYDRAKKLFIERPDFFDPAAIIRRFSGGKRDDLQQAVMAPLGVRYPKVAAHNWVENAARLQRDFDGDARNLYSYSSEAPEVLRAIVSFRGYGPKTGAMLLRAVAGLGFAQLRNLPEVLVPVDIHDSRIAFFLGLVRVPGQDLETIEYYSHALDVQRVLTRACQEAGVSWLDVDRALWLVGSRGCVSGRCGECPVRAMCAVGRARVRQEALPFAHRRSNNGPGPLIAVLGDE